MRFFRSKITLVALGLLAVLAVFVVRSIALKRASQESYAVQKEEVTEELILSGQIKADNYAQLSFQSSGKLAWVGVKQGDKVQRGLALIKLDTIKLAADLQRAYADLRSAQATLDKVHEDVKGHSADETFTQRETRTTAEVANDKAYDAVTKAQEDLRNATLFAPFTGIVSYLAHSAPGVNVLFSEAQIELVDPETFYFQVTADQTEVTTISKGEKVKIVLDSFTDVAYEGEVAFIGLTPKPGESGTVYEVRINFKEKPDSSKIRVGMSGDSKFILSQKENVLYAPPKFISSDNKGKYVKAGARKKKVYIETGLEGEDRTEIVSGVKEGETLYD